MCEDEEEVGSATDQLTGSVLKGGNIPCYLAADLVCNNSIG